MTDKTPHSPHAAAAKTRAEAGNAFDAATGYSGQDYDLTRERAEGGKLPSGTVDPKGVGEPAPPQQGGADTDQGRRASFDPATGEVRGSGAADALGDGRTYHSEDS